MASELREWISEHPIVVLIAIAAVLACITIAVGGWL